MAYSWLFPTTEAPRYHRGTSVLLSLSCVIALFAALNTLYLSRENRKKAAQIAEMSAGDNGAGEKGVDLGASATLSDDGEGDRNVHFTYIT
jgi:hypothetical protein